MSVGCAGKRQLAGKVNKRKADRHQLCGMLDIVSTADVNSFPTLKGGVTHHDVL